MGASFPGASPSVDCRCAMRCLSHPPVAVCVRGVQRLAWDPSGRRLAISFSSTSPQLNGLVALYATQQAPILAASLLSVVMLTALTHAHGISACSLHHCMLMASTHAHGISACSLHQRMLMASTHAHCINACLWHQRMLTASTHAHGISAQCGEWSD